MPVGTIDGCVFILRYTFYKMYVCVMWYKKIINLISFLISFVFIMDFSIHNNLIELL